MRHTPIIDITHEVLPDELNEQLLAMVSPESEILILEVIEIL